VEAATKRKLCLPSPAAEYNLLIVRALFIHNNHTYQMKNLLIAVTIFLVVPKAYPQMLPELVDGNIVLSDSDPVVASNADSTAPYALVAGGSKGIGYAIAEALAKRNYNLILIARHWIASKRRKKSWNLLIISTCKSSPMTSHWKIRLLKLARGVQKTISN
jgi:hypothetical protein